MVKKKLFRSKKDKMLAGVCGGIAEYYDVDSTIIRLIWVALTLFSMIFLGVIFYILSAMIIPEK